MSEPRVQTWSLTIDGAKHRVEVRGGALRRYTQWYVDGERVAAKGSAEAKLRLNSDRHGTLGVWHSPLGAPLRATVFPLDEEGRGGVDLEPDPGCPPPYMRSGSAPTRAATPRSRRPAAPPRSSYRSCWGCC